MARFDLLPGAERVQNEGLHGEQLDSKNKYCCYVKHLSVTDFVCTARVNYLFFHYFFWRLYVVRLQIAPVRSELV